MNCSQLGIAVVTFVGAMLASSSSTRHAEAHGNVTTCPVDTTETRVMVARFLASPAYEPERQEHGLTAIDTAAIRPLRSPSDSVACATIDSTARVVDPASKVTAYFTASGYYFIATRHSNPHRASGFVPFVVLDSTFALVGVFSM